MKNDFGVCKLSSLIVMDIVFSSLEECESVAHCVVILMNGQMRFIGTLSEMRERYLRGFSLQVRLKPTYVSEKQRLQQMETVKMAVSIEFNGAFKVQDQKQVWFSNFLDSDLLIYFSFVRCSSKTILFQDSIYFRITSALDWSEAFRKAENLSKQSFIMEYILTEITADQAWWTELMRYVYCEFLIKEWYFVMKTHELYYTSTVYDEST